MELASHDSKALFQFFCVGFKRRYDTLNKFNTFPKTGESLVWYCKFFRNIFVLNNRRNCSKKKIHVLCFYVSIKFKPYFKTRCLTSWSKYPRWRENSLRRL